MARVVFPSFDVRTVKGVGGGVGTFIAHLARRLRQNGDEVAILFATGATEPIRVDPAWREIYASWGVELIEVHNTPYDRQRSPELWTMRLSEELTPTLRRFDIAYLSDWGNLGFDAVRRKRFSRDPMPVCVTVLHGASTWCRLGDRAQPVVPDHVNLEFGERYTAAHSDFVVAPSRAIVDFVGQEGWTFRRPPEVLGLPFWPVPRSDSAVHVTAIRRIVYFGRMQQRKGYETFTAALRQLHRAWPGGLDAIDEIVLLGQEHDAGSVARTREQLEPTGLTVTHLGTFDSEQAGGYLRAHAAESLVVVPSPHENLPYAVIEASLIPGLNLICSRGGGAPEIFDGRGGAQLFDPLPDALAARIRSTIERPFSRDELHAYDFASANRRWLAFHDRMREAARPPRPPRRRATPTVDVCVTFYNKARHLPQLLTCLDRQTFQGFRVIAVDDGSPDPAAVEVFDQVAAHYAARGWIFFREENRFVDGARNAAARRSDADFLLMIDADDLLPPHALERLVDAAIRSGADSLGSGTMWFSGDDLPFDPATGATTCPIGKRSIPIGASVLAGVIDPVVFGGPMILIRRSVFEAVGGYREVRGAAHEDWELHARLALAGYDTDVVPEYLHYYRQLEDGLSRRSDLFTAKRRMNETFDRAFGEVGLYGAATVMWALYCDARQWQVRALQAESDRRKLDARVKSLEADVAAQRSAERVGST